MSLETTEDNIRGIKLVAASQLPVKQFPWNKYVKAGNRDAHLIAYGKTY